MIAGAVVSVIALIAAYTSLVLKFSTLEHDVKDVKTQLDSMESKLESKLDAIAAAIAKSQVHVGNLAGQVSVLRKENCPVCQKRK